MADQPRIRAWVSADGLIGTLRIDVVGQKSFQVQGDLQAWNDMTNIIANTRNVMLTRQTGAKPVDPLPQGVRRQ